jgi:hypothetical protein
MAVGVAWIRASSLNSLVLSAQAGSSNGGDLGRGCFQRPRAKEEMVLSLCVFDISLPSDRWWQRARWLRRIRARSTAAGRAQRHYAADC